MTPIKLERLLIGHFIHAWPLEYTVAESASEFCNSHGRLQYAKKAKLIINQNVNSLLWQSINTRTTPS